MTACEGFTDAGVWRPLDLLAPVLAKIRIHLRFTSRIRVFVSTFRPGVWMQVSLLCEPRAAELLQISSVKSPTPPTGGCPNNDGGCEPTTTGVGIVCPNPCHIHAFTTGAV